MLALASRLSPLFAAAADPCFSFFFFFFSRLAFFARARQVEVLTASLAEAQSALAAAESHAESLTEMRADQERRLHAQEVMAPTLSLRRGSGA